jgi:hypothetical protein
MKITAKNEKLSLTVNDRAVVSLLYRGMELLSAPSPVFRLALRGAGGELIRLCANDAENVICDERKVIYSGFSIPVAVTVEFKGEENITARVFVENKSGCAIEWIILLPLHLKPLCEDGGEAGTRLLLPYNEGALLNTASRITRDEPEYPSYGHLMMFPNMLFSQLASYLFENGGKKSFICVYTPDASRGLKEITVREGELILKLFSGVDKGEDVCFDYPLVITCGEGGWERSADEYKDWFTANPPAGLKKSKENERLPEWYDDNMLVVSYCVRGIHDMDEMKPNSMYPYENALPVIDEINKKTGMRPLTLLMHWEGTAPWAPPYVMPPYGDAGSFYNFRDELHKRGFPLGVYCSGFGYTEKSNLVDYDNIDEIREKGLMSAMCAGPDGRVLHSRICPGQRSGYDMCPASKLGRKTLSEAYSPLFSAGLDYAQILDQNHGGGQYLCYSENHGHPSMPGRWMTENMTDMLTEWNREAGKMLLGCESAAAEPFIPSLQMSDNRYELCYHIGRPVPLYAYLYHEYVRNFMGNQVSCPLPPTTDALNYRIAYSFAAGDIPTIILTDDGGISPSWGTRDFSVTPERDEVLSFLSECSAAYVNGLGAVLSHGRMIPPPEMECGTAPFGSDLPEIIMTAWEYEGEKTAVLINPFDKEAEITLDGRKLRIGKRSVLTVKT